MTLQAQDKPELLQDWIAGGNAEIYIERVGGNQGRLIALAEPQLGYFFVKNFAAGVQLPASFFSNEWKVGTALFARYYIPVEGTSVPFFEGNFGREWRTIKDVSGGSNSVDKSWTFGGKAGMAFFFNPHVSIDLYLYYRGKNSQSTIGNTGMLTDPVLKQEMGIGTGFQIFL
jgi:hypothetical protein